MTTTAPTHATRGTCTMCGLVVYQFEGVTSEATAEVSEAALLASLSHLMNAHGTPHVDAVKVEWAEEGPEAEERRLRAREAAALTLQRRLHEWSMAHHGVPWWPRCSEALWRMATSGVVWKSEEDPHDVDDGRADTSPEEIGSIFRLAQEARGWWVLVPPAEAATFLGLDTWERLYGAYVLQSEQAKARTDEAAPRALPGAAAPTA